MYRPEDWQQAHPYSAGDDSFEAGADAMLEGLITNCRVERPIEWLHSLSGKGHLVFIPDGD